MNKKIFYLAILSFALIISSCKLDNYESPSSSVYGKIIDQDGKPVQSDPSGQGVKIIYIEKGDFASPDKQSMNLKADGTFTKGLIFPGTYDVVIRDANFPNLDTLKNFVVNDGANELNFSVQPYVYVTNLTIAKAGTLINAKFNLKTIGSNVAGVERVQLFSYIDPIVGFGAKFSTQPSTAGLLVLNKVPLTTETFTLSIDLALQGNTFTKYPTSTKFWFRVGALVRKSDASTGSNPKWNYSEPVQLSIN